MWNLGKKAIKDIPTNVAGLGVIVGYFLGLNELLLLLLAGIAVLLAKLGRSQGRFGGALLLPISGILAQRSGNSLFTSPTWQSVFLFFLKVGSVLYGSGYVLLAFLQRDLVERNGWLTSQQLLDAVAIGQFTPGPVFTTATFIGYLIAGNAGAIAATIGIFLPAFVLVFAVNPWVAKLRSSKWFGGILDGVNAASLGLMAAVTYTLGRTALIDWVTISLAFISTVIVFRFQINSAWLVLVGGLVGLVARLIA
nr:chromate transporter [Aliterella atlantica]